MAAESSLTFSVPYHDRLTGFRRASNGTIWDLDTYEVYGPNMYGANAVFKNMIQGMTGAGIVLYNEISSNVSSIKVGELLNIDTSLIDDINTTLSGDARYTEGLRTKANVAATNPVYGGLAEYTIIFLSSSTYEILDLTTAALLYSDTDGSTVFQCGIDSSGMKLAVTDLDRDEAHFQIAISGGNWTVGESIQFGIQGNYNTNIWSEPYQYGTRNFGSTGSSNDTTILYKDSGRNPSGSDYVALRLRSGNLSVKVTTTQNVDLPAGVGGDVLNDPVESESGDFYGSESEVTVGMYVGRYESTTTPDRPGINYFRMLVGPDYVRIAAFVSTLAFPQEVDLDNTNYATCQAYFFGNIKTYVAYSDWNRPVAVFANDNHPTSTSGYRAPFWRPRASLPHDAIPGGSGSEITRSFLLSEPGWTSGDIEPMFIASVDRTQVLPQILDYSAVAAPVPYSEETPFIAFDALHPQGIGYGTDDDDSDVNAEIGMFSRGRSASRNVLAYMIPMQIYRKNVYAQWNSGSETVPAKLGVFENPSGVRSGVLGEIPGMYMSAKGRDSQNVASSSWVTHAPHSVSQLDENGNEVLYWIIRGWNYGNQTSSGADAPSASPNALTNSGHLIFRDDPL